MSALKAALEMGRVRRAGWDAIRTARSLGVTPDALGLEPATAEALVSLLGEIPEHDRIVRETFAAAGAALRAELDAVTAAINAHQETPE